MATIAKISSQGQITIPAWIRQRFGLSPNQIVEFTAEEDGIKLTRVATIDEKADYFSALKKSSKAQDSKRFFEENYDGSRF